MTRLEDVMQAAVDTGAVPGLVAVRDPTNAGEKPDSPASISSRSAPRARESEAAARALYTL